MQWNDIYLAGTGAFLPKTVTVEDAIAAGRYDRHSAGYTDHLSVTVAADEDNVADMAVSAGRQALARSGYRPEDVAAMFYSVVFHAGIDVWNAAAYIQQGVAAPDCFSAEVRAGSNGGLMAVEVAAAWLTAHPDAPVVVSTAGFAQVLSLVTKTDASLEAIHRGNLPWGPGQFSAANPINLIQRHDEYIKSVDRDEVWAKLQAGARDAAHQAMAEAGVTLAGIDHIVVPHFGRDLITRQCLEPLGGAELARTTWEFARQVGHLGPGDQFAGLNHLSESGLLKPGQFVLVYGVGGGFTWSCAILQILNEQPWAIDAL